VAGPEDPSQRGFPTALRGTAACPGRPWARAQGPRPPRGGRAAPFRPLSRDFRPPKRQPGWRLLARGGRQALTTLRKARVPDGSPGHSGRPRRPWAARPPRGGRAALWYRSLRHRHTTEKGGLFRVIDRWYRPCRLAPRPRKPGFAIPRDHPTAGAGRDIGQAPILQPTTKHGTPASHLRPAGIRRIDRSMPVRHDRRSNAARPRPKGRSPTRPGYDDTSRRTTCRGPPGLARHAQPAMRPEAGSSACRAGPPKAPWPVAARRASHQARRLSGPRLPQLDLLPAVAGPSPPQGTPQMTLFADIRGVVLGAVETLAASGAPSAGRARAALVAHVRCFAHTRIPAGQRSP
jgi:hypothetical protein